jgi:hyperosmotically inducible protein
MQIDQNNTRSRIRTTGALLGSLCLVAAGCASGHANERGDSTARARSHDVRADAKHNYHRDADGVLRDRDGRAVNDKDGVVHDRDGRVVSDKDGVVRDHDGRVVGDDGVVRDSNGHVVRAADNSARDRSVKPVTIANVQDGEAVDTDQQLTARIRKSIVADDNLSTNAKNVKISSNKDEVILRGPVATSEEKSRVESHAQQEAGARHVNNQLEVTR